MAPHTAFGVLRVRNGALSMDLRGHAADGGSSGAHTCLGRIAPAQW
jgi:hypothetical protein